MVLLISFLNQDVLIICTTSEEQRSLCICHCMSFKSLLALVICNGVGLIPLLSRDPYSKHNSSTLGATTVLVMKAFAFKCQVHIE